MEVRSEITERDSKADRKLIFLLQPKRATRVVCVFSVNPTFNSVERKSLTKYVQDELALIYDSYI